MPKAFFCHAHVDAGVVVEVYNRYIERFPQHAGWLDRYEIVGGNSLIEKIAEGIRSSDRFFIFLSNASVDRPWVQRELREAIMREINDVNPDFIVPVKIGALDVVPAFLTDKYVIDLAVLTEDQWLDAFDAALTGVPLQPSGSGVPNLTVSIEPIGDAFNRVHVWFHALRWAEPISFFVASTVDFVSVDYMGFLTRAGGVERWSGKSGMFLEGGPQEVREPRRYAIGMPSNINGGQQVAIDVELPQGTDARLALTVGRAAWQ